MKNLTKYTLIVCSLLINTFTVNAQFSGGTGFITDPYQISNLSDLKLLSESNTYWSSYFILTADIDASETSTWGDPSSFWSSSGFTPIGTTSEPFRGAFNGNGHVIDRIFMQAGAWSSDPMGLFGYTEESQITNLGMVNCNINGSMMYTGGLIGHSADNTEVTACYVSGTVSGTHYVGSLVGYNESSSIDNCYAIGNVDSEGESVGGLVGYNLNSASISHSYVAVTFLNTASNFFGAFTGGNEVSSTIDSCFYNTDFSTIKPIGYDDNNQHVSGLTTAEMKQLAAYNDSLDFTNTWEMIDNKTFPRLQGVYDYSVISTINTVAAIDMPYADTLILVPMDADIQSVTLSDAPDGLVLTNDTILTWTPDTDGEYTFTITVTDANGKSIVTSHTITVQPFIGSGTSDDPYQITTIDQLNSVRDNLDQYFILMSDLDFSGSDYDNINSTDGWEPIGNYYEPFEGGFDGNGYVINNLYINQGGSYTGLFGHLENATIENVSIINCKISGWENVGTLAGYINNSTIELCCSSGNIKGTTSVGGLVGCIYASTLNRGLSAVNVRGTSSAVGGLVGTNTNASAIMNCYASGNVNVDGEDAGGLVGTNEETSRISKCYSVGMVFGDENIGALVGLNQSSSLIDSCFYSIASEVATPIGSDDNSQEVTKLTVNQMRQLESFNNELDFDNCWEVPHSSAYPRIKGLYNFPIIHKLKVSVKVNTAFVDTINVIPMDATDKVVAISEGPDSLEINPDYSLKWTPHSTGQFSFTVTTSMDMNRDSTVTLKSAILKSTSATADDGATAEISTKSEITVTTFDGSGTFGDPFQITTVDQLDSMRLYSDYYYILMNDLDLEGSRFEDGWKPIGKSTDPFKVYFDGQDHTIKNLYINSSDRDVGLFGYITDAKISNLGVVDCSITGYHTGAIAGTSHNSTIQGCFATGSVSGVYCVGGIVGQNLFDSEIAQCYSSVDVTGDENVGGLVGFNTNRGSIANCYATGSVMVKGEKGGGLVGYNFAYSSVSNSYALGKVNGGEDIGALVGENSWNSTISSCFCTADFGNTDSIGSDANSQTVNRLTIAQMKQAASYNAELDFTNIWEMTEDLTFPLLQGLTDSTFKVIDISQTIYKDSLFTSKLFAISMATVVQSISVSDAPDGMLVINDSISWTPDATGSYTFTLTAEDTDGRTVSSEQTLNVISFTEGTGTIIDPFCIYTIEDLYSVHYVLDKHFVLMNDLDFSGSAFDSINSTQGWEPIGDNDNYFSGSFKGKGHSIKGLYINRPFLAYAGLFGYTYAAGIDSLNITNCHITASQYVGGLTGASVSLTTINDCFVSGSITAKNYQAGGFVGYLSVATLKRCHSIANVYAERLVGSLVGDVNYSSINQCFSSGNVSGETYVAGLVGIVSNNSTVSQCYTSSAVYGEDLCGGFIGSLSNSTLTNCYSSGTIYTSRSSLNAGLVGQSAMGSSITNCYSVCELDGTVVDAVLCYSDDSVLTSCFYNKDIAADTRAYGLTTDSMRMAESFINWNISNNNTDSIWGILEGQTYPALDSVNNAPFAFADTIRGEAINLDTLLANDYDYETGQANLVLKADSIYSYTYSTAYADISEAQSNDSLFVHYRVGELLASGDTLWGNYAKSYLIYQHYFIWNGTGTWNETAYWSDNEIPTSADFAIVQSGTLSLNQSVEVAQLTIEHGAVLQIAPNKTLTVSDKLINNAAISGLVLQSDENGTAQLLNSTPDVPATVERYITGNAWHLVSSPAPGQTISDFLSTNTNVPANGIYRGMMDYDETNNDWNSFFTNTQSGNLTTGKGFSLRADAEGVVTFTGTLASGTVSPAVARTGNYGWNCVGNPYPSAIFINENADATNNFITVNTDKLDPSYAVIYVWEDGSDAYTIVGQGEPAFYAQSGQAFMVKVNTGVTSLNFTQTMQTAQPSLTIKSGNFAWSGIELTALQDGKSRSAKIRFSNEMTAGLDVGYDAGVFKTGFDIYTQLLEDNGVDFGLQSLPVTNIESYEIPVGLNVKETGEISFSLNNENFPQDIIPVLTDNQTGEQFAFTGEGDVYTTTVNAESNGYGRFTLTFSSVTGIDDLLLTPQPCRAWYSNGQITISGEIEGDATAEVYDIQGRKLAVHRLESTNLNRIESPQGSSGVYLLRIKDSGREEVLKVVSTGN